MEEHVTDRLLNIIGMSGEMPANNLNRIVNSSYGKKLITQLKADNIIKTIYQDQIRGYRLTKNGKSELLKSNRERFDFFLTGAVDTNRVRNDLLRRLRLHRISEVLISMYNAGVEIFRDRKQDIFEAGNLDETDQTIQEPAFYLSREFKALGDEMIKVQNGRAVGVLLTPKDIFMVYNTDQGTMKWNYKSEMRLKVLLHQYLYLLTVPGRYSMESIKGMVFGRDMDVALSLLSPDKGRNYFALDGNLESFLFVPMSHAGDIQLKLIVDHKKLDALNQVMLKNLVPLQDAIHDAINMDGLPVLFAYDFDLQRINKFYKTLLFQDRKGVVICFDFQRKVLNEFFNGKGTVVQFETIDLEKFEKRFFP